MLAELVFGDAFTESLQQSLAVDQSRPSPADLLRDALALLADDDRAALVLIFYGGFTFAEAAEQLHTSTSTVSRRLASGLRRMAQLLEGGAA